MQLIGQILHLLIQPGLWHVALEASIVLLLNCSHTFTCGKRSAPAYSSSKW